MCSGHPDNSAQNPKKNPLIYCERPVVEERHEQEQDMPAEVGCERQKRTSISVSDKSAQAFVSATKVHQHSCQRQKRTSISVGDKSAPAFLSATKAHEHLQGASSSWPIFRQGQRQWKRQRLTGFCKCFFMAHFFSVRPMGNGNGNGN